jgi:hypothetical protein
MASLFYLRNIFNLAIDAGASIPLPALMTSVYFILGYFILPGFPGFKK